MNPFKTFNDHRHPSPAGASAEPHTTRQASASTPATSSSMQDEDTVPDGITRYIEEMKSGVSSYTYRPPLWRQEVATRVNAHRARRQKRDAENESLPLNFAEETADLEPSARTLRPQRNRWRLDLASRDLPRTPVAPAPAALASDSAQSAGVEAVAHEAVTQEDETFAGGPPFSEPLSESSYLRNQDVFTSRGSSALKLLSFPRSENAIELMPEVERLADPVVSSRPRILDAPDEIRQAVVPSTLFDVRLESDDDEPAATPDFQLPLQSASLSRRAWSAAVDCGIVFAATMIFAGVINFIGAVPHSGRNLLVLVLLVPALEWSLYQYLFLSYAGCTPGMQMAQLEVATFEGEGPTLLQCRARAIAAAVSCLSLGMGFLWALIDDDHLGWHDRITRTYLRRF